MSESVSGTGPSFFKHVGLRPQLDNIPDSLMNVDQWVLWKATRRPNGGGMNKIPYQPNGNKASTTNPQTWSDFGTAWAAYEEGEEKEEFQGVGFVLTAADPFVGGDIDHCRNADTSELTPLAAKIVEGIETYWEISPSGTGMRFIATGNQVKSFKGAGIELYTSGRYLTITGERYGTIDDAQHIGQRLIQRLRERATGHDKTHESKSADPTVEAIKAAQLYLAPLPGGKHRMICPWWEAHTGGDQSGTVYMEAHHNGHSDPQFVCQHSHCGDKTLADLLEFVSEAEKKWPPTHEELAITMDEATKAEISPRCIVDQYLYADVAQLVSPGGTGKTTLLLYEAICIALGRPLWGLQVLSRGWTLVLTKEDRRERLVARLREIWTAMELSHTEIAIVCRDVSILDVTGTNRKLTRVVAGNIERLPTADLLIERYKDAPPAVVAIDPLISFGASESMVNDNEQALIEVARVLVNGLDCCVRYVHHTGKANARSDSDQYSGRGGSALADGSRMTTTLDAWDKKENLPPGCTVAPNVSVTKICRHKLSYAPPGLPAIWVRREGYTYEYFLSEVISDDDARTRQQGQLLRFISHELNQNTRYTARGLDTQTEALGMSRSHLRAALEVLRAQGLIVEAPFPPEERQGAKQAFLCPSTYRA